MNARWQTIIYRNLRREATIFYDARELLLMYNHMIVAPSRMLHRLEGSA